MGRSKQLRHKTKNNNARLKEGILKTPFKNNLLRCPGRNRKLPEIRVFYELVEMIKQKVYLVKHIFVPGCPQI
jgi:hypothetical protein